MRDPCAGRIAFICPHKDHEGKGPPRRFVSPEDLTPICEMKGHGAMKRQENQPYLGQPIPEQV